MSASNLHPVAKNICVNKRASDYQGSVAVLISDQYLRLINKDTVKKNLSLNAFKIYRWLNMKKEFVILAGIIVLSFKASLLIAAPRTVYVDSDTSCVPQIEDNLIAYGGSPHYVCQDLLTVWVKNPETPPAGTRLIFSHNGLPIAVTEPYFKEKACQKNNSLYWLTVLDPYDLDHDNVACDGATETDCLFEKDDGSPETFSVTVLFPNEKGGYDEIGTDTFEFEFIDCPK